MATTVSERAAATVVEGDQCVVLQGMDWNGYLTMLRLRGERPAPRMVYCDGELWLVSPSYIHEHLKRRLGKFVEVVLEELDIPYQMAGSTTFRRRKKQVGVEGDEAYYLANLERILGKTEIDLQIDPPPDLAIEAVHTHEASAAVEVYRRLRVPEVWVCDQEKLLILARRPNGRYAPAESSVALPFLTASEIFEWVTRPSSVPDSEWRKELRRWVQEVLVPRRAGPAS